MSRTIPAALAAHLAGAATTTCGLLKITPITLPAFGITTLDRDIVYDDGTGSGPITYYAACGYTASDTDTKSDLTVDNAEAQGLIAQYPLDGVTPQNIQDGLYDSARFVQYLVNYEDLTMGHAILNGGQVGQITTNDDLSCQIELRSLSQILKQASLIELTSITCRADFGDERCKVPLRWYNSTVGTVGAENDREFSCLSPPGGDVDPGATTAPITNQYFATGDGINRTFQLVDTAGEPVTSGYTITALYADGAVKDPKYWTDQGGGVIFYGPGSGSGSPFAPPEAGEVESWSGTITLNPDGFFAPGVVHMLTGANAGVEREIESYVAATATIVLAIPMPNPIAAADTFKIRRDCAKSKAACIAYGNLPNMRAEPELPRGTGTDVQSPSVEPS
jgi:hypothetical protein